MRHTIATTIAALQSQGAPDPLEEFLFHPTRKWRFDHAWPDPHLMLAWEIEGLTRDGGRHQRLAGYAADLEKYNAATLLGWRIIRTTPRQVQTGQALAWLEMALGVKDHA